MVNTRDLGGTSVASSSSSSFLFNPSGTFGSSSQYELSASSPATTTQFFNVLSANAGRELTTVQHYNDIIRPKNTNMDSKNLNTEVAATLVVLSKDGPKNRWHSFRDRRSSFKEPSNSKITNTTKAGERNSKAIDSNERDEEREKSQNISSNDSTANEKPLNIRGRVLQRDQTVIHIEKSDDADRASSGVAMTSFINRGASLKEKILGPRERSASRKKERGPGVVRTRSLVPLSFKRNRFWSSINKSIEPPPRRAAPDRNTVPKLHIWLSSDQAPRELHADQPETVLNNTRDALPRIQLDQSRVIYRSASEGNKWKTQSDSSGHVPHPADVHRKTEPLTSLVSDTGGADAVKSPVGKQPTWPLSYNHLLSPRPKLTHQDRLNVQGSRRAELGRQDAVMDDAEASTEHPAREDKSRIDKQSSGGSADASIPSPSVGNTLSPNSILSAFSPHPRLLRPSHSLGVGGRAVRRKGSFDPPLRTTSDDKSDVSEYSWRSDSMISDLDDGASQSVFSLNEVPLTPVPSWISSNHSLHRQDTYQSRRDSMLQRQDTSVTLKSSEPASHHSPVQTSRSLCIFRHARSNSTTEKASNHARLTVPGESNKSRRPSLLSLRSLTRSPIPYISMEYDPEYENEYMVGWQYYGHASSPYHRGSYSAGMTGLIPEATPRLTLTQRLAFPNLVQNSLDRPRPRDPFSEENNGMNRAAKLITVLVLTMVTVLIVVGVYKTIH